MNIFYPKHACNFDKKTTRVKLNSDIISKDKAFDIHSHYVQGPAWNGQIMESHIHD